MDVVKETTPDVIAKKRKWLLLATVIIALLTYVYMQPAESEKVAFNELTVGTVQSGNMDLKVEGYGVLRPNKQKLITALTIATVEEIVLKPGAMVNKDSIVLRLSNPDLLQEVARARQNLAQQKANLRQLNLNNTREIMAEKSLLAELDASYETVKYRREGEEKLVEEGIVSRLNYNTSKLEEKQLKARIKIQKAREAQLLLAHKEAINIQQEQINQASSLLKMAQARVDRLTVTAGISGVLQDLPVELGQSVDAGQALALVGSIEDLIALIRVPQSHAERVKYGQTVIIDTRRDKIEGKVVRIDPAVEEGTVTVEVAFEETLPSSARPELSVNGSILTDTLNGVLFIESPVGAAENSYINLFKMNADANLAFVSPVTFGVENGRYIQVKSGANIGEQFILSDMSKFSSTNKITVTR